MIKKLNVSTVRNRFARCNAVQFKLNTHLNLRQQTNISHSHILTPKTAFYFSTQQPQKPHCSEVVITLFIQNAQTPQQLHKIISDHKNNFNFIHRTILLQKATKHPFDKDHDLIPTIINLIKTNWNHDYPVPSEINARAITNTICYMSRKAKFHHLDQQFAAIDFDSLATLINPKEFVMMFTGLLKLQLIDKVMANTPAFKLEVFLDSHVNSTFQQGLLVSMWFNIIKYKKSSPTINDFFANLLQTKHFKNNLIDYMQIIYCYVHTAETRNVDLNYTLMAHPKEIKDERGYLGAHELSVMYEQLGKLKMIQQVYFSEEFNELLGKCFHKILVERDIPLRNIANVFVNLTRWENPTSKILEAVNQKYYNVLKNQISLLQKSNQNKKFKPNVDPLSFVTLFQKLLEHYHVQNRYLNLLTFISMSYVEKIIELKIFSEYNEKTFIRLLEVMLLAHKMIEQKKQNPHQGAKSVPLYNDQNPISEKVKQKLVKEIINFNFNQVVSLEKIISFADKMNIRNKDLCTKIKKMILKIPKENQKYQTYQKSLSQPCILRTDCLNCKHCLS